MSLLRHTDEDDIRDYEQQIQHLKESPKKNEILLLTPELKQAIKDLQLLYDIIVKTRRYGNTTAAIKGCRNIPSILVATTCFSAKIFETLESNLISINLEDMNNIKGTKYSQLPVVIGNSVLQELIGNLLSAIDKTNE